MVKRLTCWSCGELATEHPLPLSTYAECRFCRAQLHTCRLCQNWNPTLRTSCNEIRAEDVTDREKANFCNWFDPRPDAYQVQNEQELQSARTQLNSLFGDNSAKYTSSAEQNTEQQLEELFTGKSS